MTATTPLTPGPRPVAGAYDPERGAEIQAFIPAPGQCFALPADVPKYVAVETLAEALRHQGATEREIAVWRHIARPTDAHAWSDTDTGAVNWRRQADMAREIGISERQFRRIEIRLESFGVLARATADNGYRGRRAGQGSRPIDCGLSVEPALANYVAYRTLLDHRDHLEEERQRMVIDARSTRRRLVRLVGTVADPEARTRALAGLADLDGRRPVPLRSADMEEVQEWMGAALAVEREVLEGLAPQQAASAREAERLPDLAAMADGAADGRTDGPDAGDIGQAGPDPERTADRDGAAVPEAPAPAADAVARVRRDRIARIIRPDVLRLLDGPGLRELASADAELYLESMDWRRAVTYICRELGVHPTAWEEAVEAMTEGIAFIALLVADRNRFHPEKPTKSVGGVLRSMATLARRGDLDLSRSVMGILARHRRGGQPKDHAARPCPDA